MSGLGDYIKFRATMNNLVALSACPLEVGTCNADKSAPIKVEVASH